MAQDKQQPKEVKAFARYIHVSPRKLRLVAALVRRAPVDLALEQLRFSSKSAALPLAKAINSAVANAIHNFNLDKDSLYVKSVTIDGGPVFKRYAPRAQGRAFIERKRTSHINVVLEAREQKNKRKRSIFNLRPRVTTEQKVESEQVAPRPSKMGEARPDEIGAAKQPGKPREKIKQNIVNLKRRLFNRKSGS